jgi:type III restriction enzyme
VKNDHLEFAIPYVHAGLTHDYHTDFLVRLAPIGDDDTIERTLIVEVSGGRKDQAVRKVKAETTREQWCPAVNNHGGFGIWDFVEIDDMTHAVSKLDAAIERLLADPLTRALAD